MLPVGFRRLERGRRPLQPDRSLEPAGNITERRMHDTAIPAAPVAGVLRRVFPGVCRSVCELRHTEFLQPGLLRSPQSQKRIVIRRPSDVRCNRRVQCPSWVMPIPFGAAQSLRPDFDERADRGHCGIGCRTASARRGPLRKVLETSEPVLSGTLAVRSVRPHLVTFRHRRHFVSCRNPRSARTAGPGECCGPTSSAVRPGSSCPDGCPIFRLGVQVI